jgi:predicted transcriptional regulator
MDDRRKMRDWQVEAIKRGMEAADRGELVLYAKVRAWAKSPGARPTPVPKSK